MKIRTALATVSVIIIFAGIPNSYAGSNYSVSRDAWQCPQVGHLLGGHMMDKDSQCIPPFPMNPPDEVIVMDVDGPYAFVCSAIYYETLHMTSMYCRYTFTSSILDKNGKPANVKELKAYAEKQTMQNVRTIVLSASSIYADAKKDGASKVQPSRPQHWSDHSSYGGLFHAYTLFNGDSAFEVSCRAGDQNAEVLNTSIKLNGVTVNPSNAHVILDGFDYGPMDWILGSCTACKLQMSTFIPKLQKATSFKVTDGTATVEFLAKPDGFALNACK